jgi:hypothetical protein
MIFPDDFTFVGVTTQPRQQFVLDQITRHWKSNGGTEEEVLAATGLPAVGDEHPLFPCMFVVGLSTTESAEVACLLNITYSGTIAGTEGAPTLPAQKHDSDDPVESQTSNYGSLGNAAQSITIQYRAPANTLSYVSFGAAGTTDADLPTLDPEVIAIVVGGINFTPASLPDIVNTFFTPNTTIGKTSTEIVAGKFWQNVSKKIKGYLPYVVVAPAPGTVYISLAAPGQNYSVGNVLTITAGGESATVQVTSLGIGQSVLTFTVLTNAFTTQNLFVSATGGSGSGAVFNVIVI